MIKVGLLGFSQGYYATTYTRYLSRLKETEIIGVCDFGRDDGYVLECADITAKAFGEEMGVPLFHSAEDLLELKPDAVLICNEVCEHTDTAKLAVKQGIHAFVSKPLTFNPVQARELLAVKPDNVVLLCGNPLKYEQGVLEVEQAAASGVIGKIYSLRLMVSHLAMTQQEYERDAARSGGPLGTYGIYMADLARYITKQDIKSVFAMGGNYCFPQLNTLDTVKAVAELSDGALCSLELFSGYDLSFPFLRIELAGEKGTICTNYDNNTFITRAETGASLGGYRTGNMGAGEMEHFLDCIAGREKERCSVTDMVFVSEFIEAVQKSIKERKLISVGGI